MRRFIIILLILIVSVWMGLKISEDPGYALFIYHHWSVAMPLWVALLGFIIIFFLFTWLYRTKNWVSSHRLPNWSFLYKARLAAAKEKSIQQRQHDESLLLAATNAGADAIHQAWDALPRRVRKDPHFIYIYAKQQMSYPDQVADVEVLLRKTLKKNWDKGLIQLYGLVQTTYSTKQLAIAEKWLAHCPYQAMLFLTLGRLSVRCQLWGKARSYFENSIKLEAYPATYIEYGKLLEQLGESMLAMQCYRDGLLHTVSVSEVT